MTKAEYIRSMDDGELAGFLQFGANPVIGRVPDCSRGCEMFGRGCAISCPLERRMKNISAWLTKEAEK